MAKDYSEDQLIQKSTAELLEKELGWKSVYAFDKENKVRWDARIRARSC